MMVNIEDLLDSLNPDDYTYVQIMKKLRDKKVNLIVSHSRPNMTRYQQPLPIKNEKKIELISLKISRLEGKYRDMINLQSTLLHESYEDEQVEAINLLYNKFYPLIKNYLSKGIQITSVRNDEISILLTTPFDISEEDRICLVKNLTDFNIHSEGIYFDFKLVEGGEIE